jgi:uncharacterized delta-60 repeat protein
MNQKLMRTRSINSAILIWRSSQCGFALALTLTFMLTIAPMAAGAGSHLDLSFSSDGKVTTGYVGNSNEEARAVAVQPDGKIVVVGNTSVGGNNSQDHNWALMRYNANGSIDTSFGANGKVNTDFAGGDDEVSGLAIQPDGKIVVGGWALMFDYNFAFARYLPNGLLDTSFGGDGKVGINLYGSDFAYGLAIQSDGKIVFVGGAFSTSDFVDHFVVGRLNSNGSLDTTFAGDGIVATDFGGNPVGTGVLAQPDGKIVACGYHYSATTDYDFILARYNSNGSLDNSFDGNGMLSTDFNGRANMAKKIVRTSNGKYVVAGTWYDDNLGFELALARYNSNGGLDTTFSGDGKLVTDLLPLFDDEAGGLVVTPTGEIVATCYAQNYLDNHDPSFTLVRFLNNGSPDLKFGTGGRVITVFGAGAGNAKALALQPDGSIVAAGRFRATGGSEDFAIARYKPNGIAVRADFDGAGQADYSLFRPADSTWYLQNSTTGAFSFVAWGMTGDLPAPGDYDGDGITDEAVYRPSMATWYVLRSSTQTILSAQIGTASSKVVQGDFDGDGITDFGVFEASTGVWAILRSAGGTTQVTLGAAADRPLPADYDGDGLIDEAVFTPASGSWTIKRSILGTTTIQFGINGDIPVPGDYDRDGLADLAVFRPSNATWYITSSIDGTLKSVPWGSGTDIPAPADIDGDGRLDLTAFRPSNGTWYVQKSTTGGTITTQFGQNGDSPISSAYTPQ